MNNTFSIFLFCKNGKNISKKCRWFVIQFIVKTSRKLGQVEHEERCSKLITTSQKTFIISYLDLIFVIYSTDVTTM